MWRGGERGGEGGEGRERKGRNEASGSQGPQASAAPPRPPLFIKHAIKRNQALTRDVDGRAGIRARAGVAADRRREHERRPHGGARERRGRDAVDLGDDIGARERRGAVAGERDDLAGLVADRLGAAERRGLGRRARRADVVSGARVRAAGVVVVGDDRGLHLHRLAGVAAHEGVALRDDAVGVVGDRRAGQRRRARARQRHSRAGLGARHPGAADARLRRGRAVGGCGRRAAGGVGKEGGGWCECVSVIVSV